MVAFHIFAKSKEKGEKTIQPLQKLGNEEVLGLVE